MRGRRMPRFGTATGYTVELLDNGDKVFSRLAIHAQTMVPADGTKNLGFSGIRGTILGGGGSDLKTGVSDNWNEGEYWIEK